MPRIILRPALVTLLIHGLLLYLLTANWETADREIIRVKPAPNVINARLVDASEISKSNPATKPKAVTVKPKSQAQSNATEAQSSYPETKACAAQAESYTQAKVQASHASKADAASAK